MDTHSTLHGDGPCADCGTPHNICWFTESVFWNAVLVDESPILCLPCFIRRVEAVGYRPVAWRVLPEWPWAGQVSAEHTAREVAAFTATIQGED